MERHERCPRCGNEDEWLFQEFGTRHYWQRVRLVAGGGEVEDWGSYNVADETDLEGFECTSCDWTWPHLDALAAEQELVEAVAMATWPDAPDVDDALRELERLSLPMRMAVAYASGAPQAGAYCRMLRETVSAEQRALRRYARFRREWQEEKREEESRA